MKKALNVARRLGVLLIVSTVMPPISAQQDIDYLSFARGAFPAVIEGDSAEVRTGFEQALAAIDENFTPFVLTPRPGGPDTVVVLIYELPALTTFQRFAVPNVGETPSPSQTFVRNLVVSGSSESAQGPFTALAAVELETHNERGQFTELTASQEVAVRWVKVELSGGIDIQREQTFLEFSEIVGYGSQEQVPLSNRFSGKWRGRGVLMELHQEGSLVTGCYDQTGDLSGAVTGNMLYATGLDRNSHTPSSFVLTVTPDGSINGVRSSNGAPFRLYSGGIAPDGTITGCSEPADITLGCDSIVYGIQFDFDSARIRAESEPVLAELYQGLTATSALSILIEGHTSSEGPEDYNQDLSERRANSVVQALVARGLAPDRISAVGKGEREPIAANDDEAGRMLNRRVQVLCSSGQ